MRALLDTSAFLWFIGGSDKLSVHAQNVIMDLDNRIVLIMVSLWEIAIKVSLGKLALVKPYEQIIPQQIEENDIELLPIAHNHLTKIIDLPFHHRDPFDRLIIAQAMTEGIPIISPDAAFSQYPIKLICNNPKLSKFMVKAERNRVHLGNRGILPLVLWSISYLIKKGCSFFFNTFYGIKVKRSAPCLPILPHDFAVLGF